MISFIVELVFYLIFYEFKRWTLINALFLREKYNFLLLGTFKVNYLIAVFASFELLIEISFQSELSTCFPIFLDRLRNEITRLTTVKALTMIASSPLRIDLKSILAESFPILGSFLRKNQRALKLATLTLLDALVNNYYSSITPQMLEKVSWHHKCFEICQLHLTKNLLNTFYKFYSLY